MNLLGDHTDTTGGLVLPLAVDRETEIRGIRAPGLVRLASAQPPGVVHCTSLATTPVPLPAGVEGAVKFVAHRTLAGSEYARRNWQRWKVSSDHCAWHRSITSTPLDDPVFRRRARHVITENQRVRDGAAALATGDGRRVGCPSHRWRIRWMHHCAHHAGVLAHDPEAWIVRAVGGASR